MKRSMQWMILCLGFLLFSVNSFANINASVDRRNIAMGETFNLIISITGKQPGTPNFTSLTKDFSVLGQSQSQQYTLVNGKTSASTQWMITLTPKSSGKLQIPALQIGQQKTAPILLTISKTPQATTNQKNPEVFIKSTLSPKTSYVNAQLLYTLRLYYKSGLMSGNVSEPHVKDAIIDRIGKDVTYRTSHNGQDYNVLERRYIIFPNQSGKQRIDPIVFTGAFAKTTQQTGLASLLNLTEKPIRTIAAPKSFTVNAKPINYRGDWLPASSLNLDESWSEDPYQLKAGDPITRTIVIQAQGLTARQLPNLSQHEAANLKVYANKPELSNRVNAQGVVGQRTEKIVYITTQAGKTTIPAINLTWFNTKTARSERTTLPAVTINVAAAPPSNSNAINATPTQATSPNKNLQQNYWPYLALFLLVAWLGTAMLWLRRHQKNNQMHDEEQNNPTLRQLKKRLQQSCMANDARATRIALLAFAAQRWPEQRMHSIAAIGKYLNDKALKSAIADLETALYGRQNRIWHGEILWHALQTVLTKRRKKFSGKASQLPNLYQS